MIDQKVRFLFQISFDPQEAEKINKNKSGNSFGGHPVLLHIFKIKDKTKKMSQSGVGSMQGKNIGNMPCAMFCTSCTPVNNFIQL